MTCTHCATEFESRTKRKYCCARCKNGAGAIMRRARNARRTERTCYRCKATKPAEVFGSPSHSYCRECWNDSARRRRAEMSVADRTARRRKSYERENQERRAASARFRRHGLTADLMAAMLVEQDGGCAICGVGAPGGRGGWHVDHDHSCCPAGRSCIRCIRGLLCTRCNVGLGNFGDSSASLLAAAEYLLNSTPSGRSGGKEAPDSPGVRGFRLPGR